MKLKIEEKDLYLRKVYAAWLGKIIGVRLGSPVENWSHERIMEEFPDKEGYLVDYDLYAADDDLNGPLFFVRALLEEGQLSAEKIGDTFLNYLQEYRGFFWWGGVGVSSEHTAYENLKKGIKAPRSGSMEVNGQAIAEQIGGQIFSDCWGYVAAYDASAAKKMAAMASSVTHDRNGIQGGIFVAVAITLAMQSDDVREVIEEALEYLDKDLEYYQIAKDIIRFHDAHPENHTDCLHYIHEHYGYDKYPGVCHILPNMALMIMAMCYGNNDFDQTLILLNRCGWDTDCNCGNVGSIMGALKGLEGIDEKWILPIRDILNASSAIGFLNIQTVSDTAILFAKLAYRLQGMEVDYDPFELPYAYKGFRCDKGKIGIKDHCLCIDAPEIYKTLYYLKEDLYDARYDPQFSPLLYPNDEVFFETEAEEDGSFVAFVEDCLGNQVEISQEDNSRLHLKIPCGINYTVHRIGIRSDRPFKIKKIFTLRHPQLHFDFKDYPIDHYGPRYEGDDMNNIRGFVEHSGDWRIKDGLLGQSLEHGLISCGAYGNTYKKMEWHFVPRQGDRHLLVISMRGYLDFYALGLDDHHLALIRKKEKEEVLCSYSVDEVKETGNILTVRKKENMLEVLFNEKLYFFPSLEMKDLFGICLGENCVNETFSLIIES